MGVYTVVEAKDNLSKLIEEALAGDHVLITRHGKPVVELTPTRPEPKPITPETIAAIRRFRERHPELAEDSVTVIRRMRDEAP